MTDPFLVGMLPNMHSSGFNGHKLIMRLLESVRQSNYVSVPEFSSSLTDCHCD